MRHIPAMPFLRILFLALGLLPGPGAVAGELKLNEPLRFALPLDAFVEVHEDKAGKLDIAQVLESALTNPGFFRAAAAAHALPPFSPSAWWLRLAVVNTSARTMPLALTPGPSDIGAAEIYMRQAGLWQRGVTGITESRLDMPGRHPALFFSLEPGEHATFVIRLRTDSFLRAGPMLYTEKAYLRTQSSRMARDAICLGGIAALALLALLIAALNRRVPFILLASFALCSVVNEIAVRGYALGWSSELSAWGYRGEIVMKSWSVALFGCAVCSVAFSHVVKFPGARALALVSFLLIWFAASSPFIDIHLAALLLILGTATLTACMLCSTTLLLPASRALALLLGASSLLLLLAMCAQTLAFSRHIAAMGLPLLSTPALALGLVLNLAALIVWSNLASKGHRKNRSARDRRLQYHARLGLGLSSTAAAAVARRAEDKARQKTQILGYLGHDLRAPLATLAGYLKLLRQSGTPEQQAHLQAMERSVGYQFGLIEQTLRYAKSELQPFTLVARATSLPDTLREIAAFGVTLCQASGNAFEFEPPRVVPALVYVDDLRLRQALFNLLSNAAQFTRQGLITLRVSAEQQPGGWRLEWQVADNGNGIAPEQQLGIFKAFEQARTSPGGAGLGLFIVDRIVGGMGGELSLDSSPGHGTTFTFSAMLQSADNRQVRMEPSSMACPPPVADDWAAPPLMARLQLARFAHNGEVSDIDSWLQQSTDAYPQCTNFLGEIRKAASHFDLDRIRTLALLGITDQQRAALG